MNRKRIIRRSRHFVLLIGMAALIVCASAAGTMAQTSPCTASNTKIAKVVALDQPFMWNRLGAAQPQGMIFALERDVVPESGSGALVEGKVRLRDGKRPRPLTLRMNVGDCLEIHFKNLLNPTREDDEQPNTRTASVHVVGLQYVNDINDSGMNVGSQTPIGGLVKPGDSRVYKYYAEREGTYLLYSGGAMVGGEGDSGSIAAGLFGAVNVEPKGAEYYRSQVTAKELIDATKRDASGNLLKMPAGHPIIDYSKLSMLQGNEIIHSDLTAIITGPNAGSFPSNTYAPNAVYPDRNQPFREFTTIFHDEIGAVQAFEQFEDPEFRHTLHSVRDAFAINYGTGGIGAEILANRLGVGPMANCVDCKYEEFFLTSWVVGDPAMVVDKPANAPGPATKALYPDDPSNVSHSYLRDHVKFRNLLAGSDDHHIFHLHAHQWLRTPDSDKSNYLDSQAIGQGTGFTYEIAWNGSGNRNQTVGDSIFHCHFYPHFAQGMWGLWRVHDVFEAGTDLDEEGRPKEGSRALPDAEILAGTPIPAVVPLPTLAMPPMPGASVSIVNGQVQIAGDGNPGYPFFIAAVAGHRPPKPPLDTVHDGGLPRHIITDGIATSSETRFDFHKILHEADAIEVPETGTFYERKAMDFHAAASHPSYKPDGTPASFVTNGRPPVAGAPYADPCKFDNNLPVTATKTYKAAAFQMDLKFNKAGWHFPQSRILALWEDVLPTINGTRNAEPFFFRVHTGDCINFHHTNLVPKEYDLDDFQVKTPTDIIGQHIHLVKFDVTSSDGSANGYNYEDGSFSPGEVQERIAAINKRGGLILEDGTRKLLELKQHPFFPAGPDNDGDGIGDWMGAQITMQRWWADPTPDNANQDRTLRVVFTHDHFGPSTHQQTGLYAGLIVEDKNTTWRDSETGAAFYTRPDGGPTSWRADIIYPSNPLASYREFLLEFGDFHLAYQGGGGVDGAGHPIPDPMKAINPPGRFRVDHPWIFEKPAIAGKCPTEDEDGGFAPPSIHLPPPCPEAVSADDPGMFTINYRNEPVALRIRDPHTNKQAAGLSGDHAHALRSDVKRLDPDFDHLADPYTQWDVKPLTKGVLPGDPATPLLRAYHKDNVKIRILVGAHEEEHNFSVNGIKWLFESSDPNSGYRNSQMMGISEWYQFELSRFIAPLTRSFADHLYLPNSSAEGLWNGTWGILRTYRDFQPDLLPLPNKDPRNLPTLDLADVVTTIKIDTEVTDPNTVDRTAGDAKSDVTADPTKTLQDPEVGAPDASTEKSDGGTTSALRIGQIILPPKVDIVGRGACPANAPLRIFDVTARLAKDALPGGTLIYNPRILSVNTIDGTKSGPLHDPTAIVLFRTGDLDANGKLKAGRPIEPLILRARAGDCIAVLLRNTLPKDMPDMDGWSGLPNIVDLFNINDIKPSAHVGLHPQLLFYNVTRSDGNNVGYNDVQTAPPGGFQLYLWYAGDVKVQTIGGVDRVIFTPAEFGATNIIPADRVKHTNKGAVGALIIEPAGTNWVEDTNQRAAATIRSGSTTLFREFVTIFQDDLHLRYADNTAVRELVVNEDAQENGQKAINYRTEPIWYRLGYGPETPTTVTRDKIFTDALSNSIMVGKPVSPFYPAVMMPSKPGDPFTPIFTAVRGTPTRFRVLHPGGHTQSHVFELQGHIWEEEPYTNNSLSLGTNIRSEWKGTLYGHGPTNHFDVLVKNGAGGKVRIVGDYLYRDYVPWNFHNGMWGVFRVLSGTSGQQQPEETPF